MHILSRIALFLSFVLIVGCTSAPKYAKERLPGQSCIDADSSPANASFSPTQAVVRIQEIDGVQNKSDGAICVAAGRHRIKIEAWTDFRKTAEIIELDLSPDLSYWLRGKLSDGSWAGAFDFQLLDVTGDKRNVVGEFSLKAAAKSFDFLFIPGRVPLGAITQKGSVIRQCDRQTGAA
jgi:hypothetical protein